MMLLVFPSQRGSVLTFSRKVRRMRKVHSPPIHPQSYPWILL